MAVLSVVAGFWKPLIVIAALFVMIMLHELGHFVMARRAGMKATEFFVGFGPRLWSVRRGETEYGVKALPLGGYVKIIGMTNLEPVPPGDEPRAYRQKPFWGRFGVAVAGSAVHMILALLLLFVLNAVVGNGLHARQLPVIDALSGIEGRPVPAADAGLQVGDEITALDGTPVVGFQDFRSYVRSRPGTPIRVDYERDGRPATTTLTPIEVAGAGDRPEPTGFVGISARSEDPTVGPVQALGRSADDFGMLFKGTIGALGKLLSFGGIQSYADQVQGKDVPQGDEGNRFLSPVGVYRIAGAAAEQGIGPVLLLLVLINIFVGIFNMLPLLPFDGGHVSIAVYEAIRSRIKGHRHFADVGKLMPVAYVTIALLVVISISSLYIDIARPLKLS
ncbi:MAG: Membrane-associated zinc metalloprotease [uncultured Acidimicrobiales bacterium]|uniref:Membrane-associated zinc metalloprotease n=1 Tax=uncultured Acidimicrobiales bacterium TaxID=310071 RepID=A0A6J4H1T5_9ACTN|nr:MAG: Membrane-associated zinc metalloprotease [uncultured Acidimicrobiales bacterium]